MTQDKPQLGNWLTREVRAALEACPVPTPISGYGDDLAIQMSKREWFAFRLQALIEKFWREECERRLIVLRFCPEFGWSWASGPGEWLWIDGPDVGGWSLLACLADAILAAQKKEVKP